MMMAPAPGQVLVVDDDDGICSLLQLLLRCEGYAVRATRHGAAALDLIRQEPPDLILLDLHMPVMGGWAFAERYRALPGPQAPLVAMSAAAEVEQRAAEIGAVACLAKPFDIDDVLAVVQRFIAPATRRARWAPSAAAGRRDSATVLLPTRNRR